MDCREAQHYFGTALDGSLTLSRRTAFFEHLGRCKKCLKLFELESVAKGIVSRMVSFVPTPVAIRHSLLQTLRREYQTTSSRWVRNLLRRLFSLPVVLAGAIAIAAFVLLLPTNPPESGPAIHAASNDLINKTLNNLQRIRDGRLKPAMVSCFPEGVAGYFEKKGVAFALHIIPMDNCDWYGAISEDYAGVSPVHIIYKVGDDYIYVCEVPLTAADEGATFSLPPAARASLVRTGWYTDVHHPPCSVVLWTTNGTLCSAASTMQQDKFVSLFAAR